MNKKLLMLSLMFAFLLASCGGSGPSTNINVTLTDFAFTPNAFTVPAGEEITLTVTNNGVVVHNFIIMKLGTTAGGAWDEADQANIFWEERDIQPDGNFNVTFTAPVEPGEYQIVCRTQGHIYSEVYQTSEVLITMGVMEKPLITSLSNPLIKQARALRQKKARLESGLFLVEGIHHVGEALEAGWDVESVLYSSGVLTSAFAHDMITRLSFTPQLVTAQVMESLADKDNPQGILALVRQKKTQLKDIKPLTRALALVAPQDPGNVGTILRTIDAVGADAMFLLDGGVELYHPTVVRASMGTLFWKPVVQTSFNDFIQWARSGNYQLIGTSAHGDVDYRILVPKTSWVLVLGNEQKGLTAEQTNACDVTVSLPMKGRVSSLNLSVAAGVLLYALNT
jgi:RNA methyltransferase, TrmH family